MWGAMWGVGVYAPVVVCGVFAGKKQGGGDEVVAVVHGESVRARGGAIWWLAAAGSWVVWVLGFGKGRSRFRFDMG